MSNKTDKSGKAKTKKHMKVSKKNKIIAAIVVILLALVCFCYFAHQAGLAAKILPGAKIVHVDKETGKEKTVKKVPIVEMNYFFSVTYNQYVMSGIITSDTNLDDVYNTNNGQTYREMLWENAANTVQTQYLMAEAADDDEGFKSAASSEYAEMQVESMRSTVKQYNELYGSNMTMDQYLARSYGKGMTVQIFRKIMKRQAVIEEYRQYVQQKTLVPTDEEIMAKYNENPSDYYTVQIQAYFVAADVSKDATAEEKTKAMEAASEKAHKIADGCQNAVDFKIRVRANCDDSYRERMDKGEDPTTVKDLSKTQLETYNKEFAELCLNPETPENTTSVFADSENVGYYAVLFEKRELNEKAAATFRVIELTDDVLKDISKSMDDKAETHNKLIAKLEEYKGKITSEADFIEMAKKYTQNSSDLLTGGYHSGITEDNETYFPRTYMNENDEEAVLADEDKQLMDWLYAPERKNGDMIIIKCVNSVKLFYFCDSVPAWKSSLRSSMTTEKYDTWYNGMVGDESYYTVINHGLIDFFT